MRYEEWFPTREEAEYVSNLIGQGVVLKGLAEHFGMTEGQVNYRVSKMRVYFPAVPLCFKRYISVEAKDRILEMWGGGERSMDEIARVVGTGKSFVRNYLMKRGRYAPKMKLRAWQMTEVKRLRGMYENGDSHQEMADVLCRTKKAVGQALRRHDIIRRRKRLFKASEIERILREYEGGSHYSEIAFGVNRSPSSVYDLLKRKGRLRRQYQQWSEKEDRELMGYKNDGLTLKHIAEKMGKARAVVMRRHYYLRWEKR